MVWHNDQVSDLETKKIIEIARECLGLPGDFVEMGCYKGDTSLLLAEVLEGQDKKGVEFKKGELPVTKREVKERFLRAGMKVPVIKKGWFSELKDKDLPEIISFAFLDGDFYESIRDSLKMVSDKVCNGGVILVHDYYNEKLPGVKRAVDRWMTGKNLKTDKFESIYIIYI